MLTNYEYSRLLADTWNLQNNFFSQENEAPTTEQTQEEKDFVMIPQKLDVNFYNTKKSMAQGMMDIALLSANAAHLKYILQVSYNALLPLSIL